MLNGKLQSRKFWLVVFIFIIVVVLYFLVSWVFTLLSIIKEDTLVKLFSLGTNVLVTIIVSYCAANVIQKITDKINIGGIGK